MSYNIDIIQDKKCLDDCILQCMDSIHNLLTSDVPQMVIMNNIGYPILSVTLGLYVSYLPGRRHCKLLFKYDPIEGMWTRRTCTSSIVNEILGEQEQKVYVPITNAVINICKHLCSIRNSVLIIDVNINGLLPPIKGMINPTFDNGMIWLHKKWYKKADDKLELKIRISDYKTENNLR